MSDNTQRECTYSGQRESALVAYVYGEMTTAERDGFEAHVSSCGACRAELSGFDQVRTRLATWTPPEPGRSIAAQPSRSRWASLHEMPVWAQAVAAVLVLGVAAGVANLRLSYGADGLSVRTGWFADGPAVAVESAVTTPATASIASMTPAELPVTRAELIALEQALRTDIDTAMNMRPGVLREARALVAASEKRQENELALRIGTMAQDVRLQREADNAKVNRVLGQVSRTTDIQARQVQNAVNSLAIKVAQRQ